MALDMGRLAGAGKRALGSLRTGVSGATGKMGGWGAAGAGFAGAAAGKAIGDLNVFIFFALASLIHLFDVSTGFQRPASLAVFANITEMWPMLLLGVALVVWIAYFGNAIGEQLNRVLIVVLVMAAVIVSPLNDLMVIIYTGFILISWLLLSEGTYDELKALMVFGAIAYVFPFVNSTLPNVSGFDWRIFINPVLHPWLVYYGLFRFRETKSLVRILAFAFLIFIWFGNLFFWSS